MSNAESLRFGAAIETAEEFAIAVRAEDRGFDHASGTHPDAGGKFCNFPGHPHLSGFVAHDPAPADFIPPDFKLRLDERDHLCPRLHECRNDRQNLTERNERNVGDREVEAFIEVFRFEVTRVDILTDFDARVLPELPVELPMPDVERHDARRAALQQAVSEPAR